MDSTDVRALIVDADKAARVARLLFHTVLEIANRDERPVWDPAGLEEVRAVTGGREESSEAPGPRRHRTPGRIVS